MTEVQVNKIIFYFQLNSKPNDGILGITVSMWKRHGFETIFTSNDVMNIKYTIGNVFGSIERACYMGVNAYFGPRRTNIPHSTLIYEPGKFKFKIYYYRQKYCFPENWLI